MCTCIHRHPYIFAYVFVYMNLYNHGVNFLTHFLFLAYKPPYSSAFPLTFLVPYSCFPL